MIVKIQGVSATIKMFERLRKNVKTEQLALPKNLAMMVKRRVKANLQPHDRHSGHNTPEPIESYIGGPELIKGKGYRIFMKPYMVQNKFDGGMYDLTKVVEYGAKPHFIPITMKIDGQEEIVGGAEHPGFKGKRYFGRAVADVVAKREIEVSKSVARIMRIK